LAVVAAAAQAKLLVLQVQTLLDWVLHQLAVVEALLIVMDVTVVQVVEVALITKKV
jgi:hypothetical protein